MKKRIEINQNFKAIRNHKDKDLTFQTFIKWNKNWLKGISKYDAILMEQHHQLNTIYSDTCKNMYHIGFQHKVGHKIQKNAY